MQNYLSNMFTSIQNGQIARLRFILQFRKKTCEALLKILWKEGYILGYQVVSSNSNYFKIFLKYKNDKPVVNSIKKLSNPNSRLFYCVNDLWKVTDNNSLIVVFTSKGVKSTTGSKKLQIGGRLFVIIN